MSKFDGPLDDNSREDRLTRQHEAIRDLMQDGNWRTLNEISAQVTQQGVGCPVASASAQLRHLRKPRFGGYKVEKKHVGKGLYQYRLLVSETNDRESGQNVKIKVWLVEGRIFLTEKAANEYNQTVHGGWQTVYEACKIAIKA